MAGLDDRRKFQPFRSDIQTVQLFVDKKPQGPQGLIRVSVFALAKHGINSMSKCSRLSIKHADNWP